MINAAQAAIWSALLLAMAGTVFGVCMARLVWADDLKHALRLRELWEQTRTSMEETIKSQQSQIDILRRTPPRDP